MSRNLSFFVEGWALGLTAYALVFTREVPTVFAQAPVETDCSTPLDQPDTTYLLNANVASDCIIAADNIILDGQSLYEIAGSVRSNTSASFSIQNAPYIASVYAYYAGDVTIQSSTVYSYAYTSDGHLTIDDSTIGNNVGSVYGGAVYITNSTVVGDVRGYSGISITNSTAGNVRADVGDVNVTEGSTVNDIHAYGGYTITISESEVNGSINATADVIVTDSVINSVSVLGTGLVTVADSTVYGSISGERGIALTNATVAGNLDSYTGYVAVTDSTVGGYVHASGGEVVIADSTIQEEVFSSSYISVTGSTVEGEVDAGTTVSIIDSDISGQVAGDGITATDSRFGNKIWSREGDVLVTNSIIAGGVAQPAFVPQPILLASIPHGDGYSTGNDGETAITTSLGEITVINSLIDGSVWMSAGTPDGVITIERSTVYGSISAQNNAVTIIDSAIIEGGVSGDNLTLTDNPPSLTVSPLDLSLDYGDNFNSFSGVSADDIKDGDLSDEVVMIGELGQQEGVYELLYTVTDEGTTITWNGNATTSGPSIVTTTRTVTRSDKPTQSTSVGTRQERKEQEITEAPLFVPRNIDATLETLKTVLAQPLTTNDPEQLKKLLNLLLQLVVALTQLIATEGKQ